MQADGRAPTAPTCTRLLAHAIRRLLAALTPVAARDVGDLDVDGLVAHLQGVKGAGGRQGGGAQPGALHDAAGGTAPGQLWAFGGRFPDARGPDGPKRPASPPPTLALAVLRRRKWVIT